MEKGQEALARVEVERSIGESARLGEERSAVLLGTVGTVLWRAASVSAARQHHGRSGLDGLGLVPNGGGAELPAVPVCGEQGS